MNGWLLVVVVVVVPNFNNAPYFWYSHLLSVFRDVSELFRERISVESRMNANPRHVPRRPRQVWIGGMFT